MWTFLVLEGSRPLLAAGLVERLLLQALLPSGLPIYQISFDISLISSVANNSSRGSGKWNGVDMGEAQMEPLADLQMLQEDLRSAMLKLRMRLGDLPALGKGCSWSLGLVTCDQPSNEEVRDTSSSVMRAVPCDAMALALQSGMWIVDNECLPEERSTAVATSLYEKLKIGNRMSYAAGDLVGGLRNASDGKDEAGSRIVAVKSFDSGGLNCAIYIHVHGDVKRDHFTS